jgi:8-oxo-dGTP pyrophosphatase MutT (NUDIX family)
VKKNKMRSKLLLEIENFNCHYDSEIEIKKRFIDFVKNHSNCFERTLLIGHVTASALIFDSKVKQVLLIHHKKLNKWLQPGGHCDGDSFTLGVAQKEVLEETGLNIPLANQPIFDLDIHVIPERKGIPEHLHYDVRYLFEASINNEIVQNHETNDISWIELSKMEDFTTEESLLRMKSKLM